MPIRLVAGLLALVLAGLYVVWLDSAQPAEIRKAARLAGERWYRLLMEGEHIGYVHTRSWRDAKGGWRFETLTHFSLNHEAPVSISDRLDFHHAPPYPLIAAEHWNRRGGSAPEGVVMASDGKAMWATLVRGTETDTRPTDWDYRLRDYLGLEIWLAEQQPPAGARFTARMPDFDRGTPVNRTFQVVERNATGYLVTSPAPLRATTIQLDHQLVPAELSMAGVFAVRRASRREALAARTPLHLTNYRIPLDRAAGEPGHHRAPAAIQWRRIRPEPDLAARPSPRRGVVAGTVGEPHIAPRRPILGAGGNPELSNFPSPDKTPRPASVGRC